MTLTVHRVNTPEQLQRAFAIRREVFIGEQGVTEAEELDGLDDEPTTHHVIAVDGGVAVGTARLLAAEPGLVHVGRVAVRSSMRGRGVGAAMMADLEHIALAEFADTGGTVRVQLSAQVDAIAFYERIGYAISPGRYLDARIWHRDAHKVLRA